MTRRAHPSPTLNVVDAGLALLGVEVLRRLGLPCPSDAEVLRFRGVPGDPDAVDNDGRFLREKITAYLLDGMLLDGLERRAARDARG